MDQNHSGERLIEVMQERGFSINRLSAESGISGDTIRRMRKGNYVGYVDSWVRIANVMGVGLTDLLQDENLLV